MYKLLEYNNNKYKIELELQEMFIVRLYKGKANKAIILKKWIETNENKFIIRDEHNGWFLHDNGVKTNTRYGQTLNEVKDEIKSNDVPKLGHN